MWDGLWRNGKVATMREGSPFGLIARGAIGVEGGRIAWVGDESALPGPPPPALVTCMTSAAGC